MAMEVIYHPLFERWLAALAEADDEIFGEVMALLTALEAHGRALGDPGREESHPVVTSRYDMHALRRVPPSLTAPYATAPPVLRVLYAYRTTTRASETAAVLLGGDKTRLGNHWYPANVAEAEQRLAQLGRRDVGLVPIVKRGRR